MKKWQLIEWLQSQISACESRAEEYVQELDDAQTADRVIAKAEAFQEVIDYIKSRKKENANPH